MKQEWLSYFRCPVDGGELKLENAVFDGDRIVSGVLVSAAQKRYEIQDGIVDFFRSEKTDAQKKTISMFGHEWKVYDQWGWLDAYPDDSVDSQLKYYGALKSHGESAFTGKAPFVEGDLNQQAVVLDAGCGNGRHARVSSQKAGLVFCVDASDAIYSARNNLRDRDNICFVKGDIFKLPFADNTFDAAYSIGVMQHTGDAKSFIRSLLRVVKPSHPVTINCYGTGMWSYEFFDWAFRFVVTRLSKEKQMKFASCLAAFDRYLQKKKSKFAKYLRIFLQSQICLHSADCIMYDWYAPEIAEHYTPAQVDSLVRSFGGIVTNAVPDFVTPGYNDSERKFLHSSFQFRAVKNDQ